MDICSGVIVFRECFEIVVMKLWFLFVRYVGFEVFDDV